MKIVYKWKYLDYVWDNPEHKENAINSSNYNVSTCFLNDVDKADDGRIFATVPKMFNFAVPASVVTVSDIIESGGPLLHPYPDWSWYNNSNMCDNIVNVYMIHVFISDMIGSGLVIYDSSKNSSCRVESDFMGATDYINITIANQTVPFMADLFYNPFTEKKVYKMKIKKLLKCPDKETANNQTKLVGELSIQTGPLASTKCSLFLSNYLQNSIQGTNACKKFYPKDMVVFAQNDKKLQIVTGMKALQHHNELMALSTMTYITYPNVAFPAGKILFSNTAWFGLSDGLPPPENNPGQLHFLLGRKIKS
ncbi:PREDICTED: uncharacterized protein LOC105143149 [Acromyrmex echinatior]|uniref:uncharacterized protein LOC105143149 n=1 Tax=Acromyrmex echinatior TaxID=103372 RepID=UPI0005810781|nr:PREDICTED: uncharacterized protein LOC105143149 [Acromyrmex echinatior]